MNKIRPFRKNNIFGRVNVPMQIELKTIISLLTVILCLGCETVSKFWDPVGCEASYKEEKLDFDSNQELRYFTSRNPRVSNLLLSPNQELLFSKDPLYLSYSISNGDKSILINLKTKEIYPLIEGRYHIISNGIFYSENVKENTLSIFRIPYQKILKMPNSFEPSQIYISGKLIRIKDNKRFGVINLEGHSIVLTHFDEIHLGLYESAPIIAVKGEDKYIYDREGNLLLTIRQNMANGDTIRNISKNGFLLYQKDSNWGVLDQKAKVIVSPKYESISNFSDGLAAVQLNDQWGYIDESGKVVVPIEEGYASPIYKSIGRRRTKDTNECILFASDGKEIIRYPGNENQAYENCSIFNTRTYIQLHTKTLRYFVKLGKEKWAEVDSAKEVEDITGDYIISKDGKYGVISFDERFFIPMEYNNIQYNQISKQYVLYQNGKSALYDVDGLAISSFLPGHVYSCDEGICLVQNPKTGKFGYFESGGKEIISMTLDYAEGISEGHAKISRDGKWELIDRQGKPVLRLPDHQFGSLSGGIFWRKQGSFYGYQNEKGDWVVEPMLDSYESISNGIAIVSQNGKFGILGNKGNWIVPPTWDHIKKDQLRKNAYLFRLGERSGIAMFTNCD